MARSKKYTFEAVLERHTKGMRYHCIYFPFNVEKEFGSKGQVRVLGIFNGVNAERALIPNGQGEHHIVFGTDLRRELKVRMGDVVSAEVWLNPDPLKLDIPEELEAIFEIEPLVKTRFETKLTNSTRRNICYWINSAKREETRTKRALDMMNRLLKDEFDMGGRKISML